MAHPDQAVWADILAYLRQHHPAMCRQWFEEIEPLGPSEGVFKLRAHQDVHKRYLENKCIEAFNDALQSVTNRLWSVKFLGPDDAFEPPAPVIGEPKPSAYRATPVRHPEDRNGLVFIPDYTFEHFVVGPENRLAHAAARAVADSPAKTYNPLFMHGGVGLGKTHLLQAVCLQLLQRNPDIRIHYTSCEDFQSRFFAAVQAGEMQDFRHRFRDVDLLAIDDIHFLAKRDRTQEEFFHTFNALYQSGRQVVLSSDAPPHEIPDLEARLVSRFQSGLVVPINQPCYETRVQIVKQKARLRMLEFPDEVACYIAGKVKSNIRELEGAITRVQMLHQTDHKPITESLARLALDDPTADIPPEITIDNIIEVVVDYYGVKLTDLQSKRRQKSIAHPRQVCMYLARKQTRYSLEEIGGYFGGRDHTTVMHAVRTIEDKRVADGEIARVLTALEHRLGVPEATPPAKSALNGHLRA